MVTAIIREDKYKTKLIASGHELFADESEEVGGEDTGPNPGQILLMSLASCTAITVRMYADRKQWPLKGLRVEVDSHKENDTTIIDRHITLEGSLNSEQSERLLQIANACPVHKTLTHPIEIKTKLL